MKPIALFAALLASVMLSLLNGCQTAPNTETKREALNTDAEAALAKMKAEDPSLEAFLDKAHGYAILPSIGKGGFIAGGAYGRGLVYEQGEFIGYADLSQATIGLQAGGQTFSELIVFENKAVLDRFRTGKLSLAANLSAVILKSGAAESARFTDGIAVFVKPIGGAMVEAAVGGQQFTFQPK